MKNDVTYLGRVNFRNDTRTFGIRDRDRLSHIYCIGKTSTGKSTLLQNMAISDIERGNGLCIIDPHGDLAENILNYIPQDRIEDVIYFNAADIAHPIALNPLKQVHPKHRDLVASGLISTFRKIWETSWGNRMERILNYSIQTLLEHGDATLLDIQPLLTDAEVRKQILARIRRHDILQFWHNEFATYSKAFRAEAIVPVLNKVGKFASSEPLRNIFGQKTRSFHMQEVMDKGKILICNLAKGKIGEDACSLLGSVIATSIQLAALYRANQPEHTRRPFYLYIDECHSFLSLSFAGILAEARKYGLSLYLTHQYTDQLQKEIRDAVFGNVGTLISFRVGASDAELLAKEFYPVFNEIDLINLPRFSMYLKLMIDGETSRPFSAFTMPVKAKPQSCKHDIVVTSQSKFGSFPRIQVTKSPEKNNLTQNLPLFDR